MKAILFDLDGTLVDSSEGIIKSVRRSLQDFGLEEADDEKLKLFIGPPLVDSFMRLYHFTEEQAVKAVETYRVRYKKKGMLECRLYPYVKECITQLKEEGYLIGIASSKPEVFCRAILENLGVLDLFDDVAGATFDGRISNKEEVLDEVMRRWNHLNREDMCLIGDTIYDVKGANYAGIACIGVTYGFGDVEEMKQEGIVALCDSLDHLPTLLKELN